MFIDPENPIIQLCAQGMELEGDPSKAAAVFMEAWNRASSDSEKAIAAHYVARHQDAIAGKLLWDEKALHHAKLSEETAIRAFYPSLYLNIAKCHEDLQAFDEALRHYCLAQQYAKELPDDGYSRFIRDGINRGIARVS
jgi:hypothetical protein